MFTVYALVSESTGKIYIGQTIDIEARLKQHNSVGDARLGKYTEFNKGPWSLVYSESYPNRSEALLRERQLKSFRGRQFIKNIINKTRP